MDKRKIILLAVAGVCILAAGVAVYMQMTDKGPPPKAVPTIQEITKDPAIKKGYEEQLQIQENNIKKGNAPAGS